MAFNDNKQYRVHSVSPFYCVCVRVRVLESFITVFAICLCDVHLCVFHEKSDVCFKPNSSLTLGEGCLVSLDTIQIITTVCLVCLWVFFLVTVILARILSVTSNLQTKQIVIKLDKRLLQ